MYQMSSVFVIIKMCYVHNQWYNIACATLYFFLGYRGSSTGQFVPDVSKSLPCLETSKYNKPVARRCTPK